MFKLMIANDFRFGRIIGDFQITLFRPYLFITGLYFYTSTQACDCLLQHVLIYCHHPSILVGFFALLLISLQLIIISGLLLIVLTFAEFCFACNRKNVSDDSTRRIRVLQPIGKYLFSRLSSKYPLICIQVYTMTSSIEQVLKPTCFI